MKAEIDAIIWYGGNVQHSLTADGGYTTRLELEAKLPEDLVADLAEEIKGDYTGIIAYYRDAKTGKEHTLTAGDQSKPRRRQHLYATNGQKKCLRGEAHRAAVLLGIKQGDISAPTAAQHYGRAVQGETGT